MKNRRNLHTHTHTHTNKLLLCGLLISVITLFPAWANDELDAALRATYTACVGIDDEMQHLKTMAGINTAVTSVGTVAGVGAIATGFVKANKDKQISVKLEKLREIEQRNSGATSTDGDWDKFSAAQTGIEQYRAEIEKYTGVLK